MDLLDFGAIARSGMLQVPDYGAQVAADEQRKLLADRNSLDQQTQLLDQQKTQRELEEEQQYQSDLGDYFETGDPNILIRLQAKYPKKSEALKRAIDSQDVAKRTADRRSAADIHAYIASGNPQLAAKKLRDRIEKARQAGEPDDENDIEVLAMLESGDPEQVKQAQTVVSYHLAMTADDFSKALKDLGGDEKLSPFMREYNDRVKQFGQANADKWASTQDAKDRALIVQGKGIYDAATVFSGGGEVTEGGGLASGGGAAPPTSAAPTDIYSITETIESGGNPNAVSPKGARGPMQTMPDTLRDPGFGVTPARDNSVPEMRRVGREYIDAMRTKYGGDMKKAWAAYNWGPGNLDAAIEKHGNNWLAKAPSETRNYVRKAMSMLKKADKTAAPVKVTSVQQASALPPGTLYMRPDGKVMKR